MAMKHNIIFGLLLLVSCQFTSVSAQSSFLVLNQEKYIEQVSKHYRYKPKPEENTNQYLQWSSLLRKKALPEYLNLIDQYNHALIYNDSMTYLNQSKEIFLSWLYLNSRQNLSYDFQSELKLWQEKNMLRLDHGDISPFEFTALDNYFKDQIHRYQQDTDELLTIGWKIRKYTLLEEFDLVPFQNEYQLYEINKIHKNYQANGIKNALKTEIDLLNFLISNTKSNPFNKLDEYLADELKKTLNRKKNSYEQFQKQLNFEKEYLKEKLNSQFVAIKNYENEQLVEAQELKHLALFQIKKDDITYIEYLKKINQAINYHAHYLELIHDYNLTALQLEYYAY